MVRPANRLVARWLAMAGQDVELGRPPGGTLVAKRLASAALPDGDQVEAGLSRLRAR